MNHFMHGVARAVAESFALPEPIVEIGSYQVAGQEEIGNLRELFPGTKYLGIDIREGPGVDLVGSVESLPCEDASAGTVIALNTFEHVTRFWRGFAEVRRVLRPDGVFFVSVPFYFHIHQYPSDYWRFTPEGLAVLLEDYPAAIIGWQGPEKKPLNVWAIAFGENGYREEQLTAFRKRIDQYARDPMAWSRLLRYSVGRWICGSRPFLPYLKRNSWGMRCHTATLRSNPAEAA